MFLAILLYVVVGIISAAAACGVNKDVPAIFMIIVHAIIWPAILLLHAFHKLYSK